MQVRGVWAKDLDHPKPTGLDSQGGLERGEGLMKVFVCASPPHTIPHSLFCSLLACLHYARL